MKYNKNEVTGKMRDRIILQNVTRVRSLSGFASESWADIATIWAFAESKLPGSNETIIDGKNTAKNVCDFTIRYISTITEESRVVWGDKLYQVKNLKVSHDRRFISFTGVFYDSYILTGVNVAASVNGIATTSANLKLIMSVIGQVNAIASSFADLTVFQQGAVDVAASVNALGTSTANLTKVINIDSAVDAKANISAPLTISKNIESSVDATATTTGGVQLGKLLSASVNANATTTSILDVVTQGVVLVDASVTATGETTANLTRIVTLESSSTTAAETSATAILTKVLEASATASAETNAAAQITIPVNASATATAETSATAQLSYTVNSSADATALTSAEAQIVRIISAEATAIAESSAEASFGVTFVADVTGTATVTNANIARTATLAASVTGAATVTSATLDVVSSLLLDLYPNADAAYSLRKLRTAYTGSAIRVRRSIIPSGQPSEQDIGFDANGNLDTVALLLFCGVGNGFVTTWYDQSGNLKNGTQATAANQPQIVSSGIVITLNSKATISLDGTNDFLDSTSVNTGNPKSIFIATKFNNVITGEVVLFDSVTTNQAILLKTNTNIMALGFGTVGNLSNTPSTNFILYSILQNSTSSNVFVNSSAVLTNSNLGTNSFSGLRLGAVRGSASLFYNGSFSECIIYSSNQTTNRINIESNINTYHGIY
jgi:SPP1 family predicted phage head-tail adaptor